MGWSAGDQPSLAFLPCYLSVAPLTGAVHLCSVDLYPSSSELDQSNGSQFPAIKGHCSENSSVYSAASHHMPFPVIPINPC
jgi:hypothetical protein